MAVRNYFEFIQGASIYEKCGVPGTATGAGLQLSENSLKVLEKRYLKRNEDGTVVETAVDMFQRVARP